MNTNIQALGQGLWVHLRTRSWLEIQRLTERWWQRWVYALTGLALGAWTVWLIHTDVAEDHAQAEQGVSVLRQQLSLQPAALSPAPMSPDNLQSHMASLPALTLQGQIWTDWQHVLTAHGLRLESLQPTMPTGGTSPATATGTTDLSKHLLQQTAAMQLRGRFEDWTRLWASCAKAGPVCSIDRIRIAATDSTHEVLIHVVLRLWMRPDEAAPIAPGMADEKISSTKGHASAWTVPLLEAISPHSERTLFVPDNLAPDNRETAPLAGNTVRTMAPTLRSAPLTADARPSTPGEAMSPQDPRHWPLAQVRLAGLWQRGHERQAILSTDTHWAKVGQGQRVTQEGHQVLAITDEGVSLRLGSGPVIQLGWQDPNLHLKKPEGAP
jgi:hypothetical protein